MTGFYVSTNASGTRSVYVSLGMSLGIAVLVLGFLAWGVGFSPGAINWPYATLMIGVAGYILIVGTLLVRRRSRSTSSSSKS